MMRALVLCVCCACWLTGIEAEITTVNNGYEGITIAIGQNVPEDPNLLAKLQERFTKASEKLFKATRHRLYFRNITIIVPTTWRTRDNYEITSAVSADKANIFVHSKGSCAPFVVSGGECGTPGKHMHIRPDIILADKTGYGPHENIIVHEWGHLRWGLKDEYPSVKSTTGEIIRFYLKNGKQEPVRCHVEFTARAAVDCRNLTSGCPIAADGSPDPRCRPCPSLKSGSKASLMGYQYLSSLEEFCDANNESTDPAVRHNPLAPNQQNLQCKQSSAWEIMRQHPDFKDGNNPPIDRDTDTTPTFRLVQHGEGGTARVLILDTSGSMSGTAIQQVNQAARNYILHTIEDDSYFGIVKFSSGATELHPLIQVTSDSVRQTLADNVPTNAGGSTVIGSGLRKGLEVLQNGNWSNGGILFLVSDGKASDNFIADVLPTIKKRGVTVDSLAYTDHADPNMEQLAKLSGGISSFTDGSSKSTALTNAFTTTVTDRGDTSIGNTPILIDNPTIPVQSTTAAKGTFHIDPGLGNDTVIQVTHRFPVNIIIRGPRNHIIASTAESQHTTISIPGTAESGTYSYTITTNTSGSVYLSVQSKPSTQIGGVIRAKAWLSSDTFDMGDSTYIAVYAYVEQDGSPVVRASVTALIEGPNIEDVNLDLRDSGYGADTVVEDGIYSGLILANRLQSDGRHNVRIIVSNPDGKAEVWQEGICASSAVADPYTNAVDDSVPIKVSMAPFNRVTQAGVFTTSKFSEFDPTVDSIPPARISDLSVAFTTKYDGAFILSWTAVGDDMDTGNASSYDIRMSPDFTQITSDVNASATADVEWSNSTLHGPKAPGDIEQVIIRIPDQPHNDTFYVVVRAIDDSGNIGELSNIVSISKVTDPIWLPTPPVTVTGGVTSIHGVYGGLRPNGSIFERFGTCLGLSYHYLVYGWVVFKAIWNMN